MDQKFDFRALLIKLQDCLSDNDRRRLHFIVGDTIPRCLRDDPTLGGTLSLLESLFDQAKISEEDFDYLIQAFNEIHCYAGVKRLQEYQLAKQGFSQRGTMTSDIIDDNEEDKINIVKGRLPTMLSIDSSKPLESKATENENEIIVLEELNKKTNNLPMPIKVVKSDKKTVNINLTFIKQTLKSRLTTCQLILLLLNILGILILVIVIVTIRKQLCSTKPSSMTNVLIIREGNFYGESLGGDPFNDATANSLTLNDQLVGINATWCLDTLTTITFIYSNGGTSQHGNGDAIRKPIFSSVFFLRSTESFNGVILYTGLRDIINPYQPNGTNLIVGIQFFTNKGRQSDLFGSSDGLSYSDVYPDYILAYVQGRCYAFIDALQFIWVKGYEQSTSAMIADV